ncbi:phosphotransferase family protein [Corynebacterium sp. H113]|uniref:phosphotransferase family protein n=1 Tax=Corynebacterium sp. H113 TaxID=3133419 RepID=UPI0030B054E7
MGHRSDQTPFDLEALPTWLDSLPGATRGEVTLHRLGAGQSNLTYCATDGVGHSIVLRRPPRGSLASSAHDVAREGRIMSALSSTNVPVPGILGIHETPNFTDVPVVAMEMVAGEAVTSPAVAERITPDVRRVIAENLIEVMARIHEVNLDEVGLSVLSSHDPYAPRQLRRWSTQWERTKTRESSALDALTERLWDAIPEQDTTTLVHGDLHLGNVMCNLDTGEVTAVVDWELATLGAPLADVGSLRAYWPERGGLVLPGFEAGCADGFPTGEELAQMYLQRTGRDPQALDFWYVLGLWKVAIIAEGVVRRVQEMPSNAAPTGAPTVAMVDQLVDYATATADAINLA